MQRRADQVRVTGPLVGYADGFSAELRRRRYTDISAWHQLRLFAQLSRWLEERGVQPGELTRLQVSAFLHARKLAAPTGPRTERALGPMLVYLRRIGAVPEPKVTPPEGPMEILLERYRLYLARERGLVGTTVGRYGDVARLFLDGCATANGLDLSCLCAADVTQFVLRESQRHGVGSAKNLVTGLRSLLRFLHVEGEAPALAEFVLGVAGWGGASLPQLVDRAHLARMLASCDRETAAGRRDYAMLTLLVRLGLRAREVVALELDDFDWRRGEVVIHGKGRRVETLPIPFDVGDAVTSYVEGGRPGVQCRRLFLRVRAPLDGELTVSSVGAVVRLACVRAGMKPFGPHRLRHTAASEMLRSGASLAEVGQVLRHRSLGTTAIYAKVDRAALRALVQPWPGGVA